MSKAPLDIYVRQHFSLIILTAIGTIAVAINAGVWAQYQYEAGPAAARRRVEIATRQTERWCRDLQVPPSALYCDQATLQQISQVRATRYRDAGVEKVADCSKLHAYAAGEHELVTKFQDFQSLPIDLPTAHSYEAWSRNQAIEACLEMAESLEIWDAESLQQHPVLGRPEVFHYLQRLLTGISPETDKLRVSACRALLAAGNRGGEVNETLSQLLEASLPSPQRGDPQILEEANQARREAARLNEQYRLGL